MNAALLGVFQVALFCLVRAEQTVSCEVCGWGMRTVCGGGVRGQAPPTVLIFHPQTSQLTISVWGGGED
jgi:hypothetical protein